MEHGLKCMALKSEAQYLQHFVLQHIQFAIATLAHAQRLTCSLKLAEC